MNKMLRWFAPARSVTAGNAVPEAKEQRSGSLLAIAHAGMPRWSQADYATMARTGFMANPVVYRCVRLIAETASTIPLLAYEGARELDDHPALALLARPNPRQGGREMMETLIGHLLVSGNAYLKLLRIDDEPKELHCLRPDRMQVSTDSQGWVRDYIYSAGSTRQRFDRDEDGRFELLHLALFHPLDDQYGMPPLQAALMALDIHSAASRWNKALLDNSARPSGALVYSAGAGTNLTDDQFERLKDELENGYSGAARAGRPLLLEGGLDWKAMGYSPKDMDFIEARNAAARDIALAFGVPPMLLGIPGDNTYSNYHEANRAFVRQTLLPLVNRNLDAMSHWLAAFFGEPIRLAVDEDRIEGLAAEREAVWSRLTAADFLTDDEKREALGYSPLRGESGR